MSMMTMAEIQKIRDLVGDRLGFSLSVVEQQRLATMIASESERLGIASIADYGALLENRSVEDQLWQHLIVALANTESYFFREQSQFELLRSQILPELIQRRSSTKTLTLWSAGCATGEEAYSLAILLTELIPDIETWHIKIFGTDINTEALAIARKGIYSEWSLRSQNAAIHERYFSPVAEHYQIKPELCDLVEFCPANLLGSSLPAGLQNIDLILCRHVFIHLEVQAIAKALSHFKAVLRPDGYLMTGHSELYSVPLDDFRAQIFSGLLLYQLHRETTSRPTVVALPSLQPKKRRSPHVPQRKLHLSDPIFHPKQAIAQTNPTQPEPLKTLICHRRYLQAIALLDQQLHRGEHNFHTHYTLACLHTHLAQYSPAAHHCTQALELNHMSELPSYLLGQIAVAQGRFIEAKRILRQIIFFNPDAALAYYDLAHIYYLEKDGDRAQSLEQEAWNRLQNLPLDQVLDPFRNCTVQQLYDEINTRLALIS